MTPAPIIEINELTHIYNPSTAFEKKAVDCVSLVIGAGERIGLIGHTGSGKSTLIQHLNALLKPTAGRVLFEGADIGADKKALKHIRQRVGLVFQYPEHQLFEETVYKDIAFGPANMGLPPDDIKERVHWAIDCVGLSRLILEKSPFELSGGQKRRAAIAGVLAMRPQVLVLDEPTAGLDPGGRSEILSQIKSIANGQTVVLVSHNMEDIAKIASRVLVMDGGRVICDGPPKEVFCQIDMLESIGLAAPQAAVVMKRLKDAGLAVPDGIYTADKALAALAGILGKAT